MRKVILTLVLATLGVSSMMGRSKREANTDKTEFYTEYRSIRDIYGELHPATFSKSQCNSVVTIDTDNCTITVKNRQHGTGVYKYNYMTVGELEYETGDVFTFFHDDATVTARLITDSDKVVMEIRRKDGSYLILSWFKYY